MQVCVHILVHLADTEEVLEPAHPHNHRHGRSELPSNDRMSGHSHECIHTLQIDFPGVTICPSNKVVEEKVNLIKAQSPWAEDIEEYGEINFDKLLYLLTGFRNIPEQKWDDFDELEGLIDRLGQGNLTTLMRKVSSGHGSGLRNLSTK